MSRIYCIAQLHPAIQLIHDAHRPGESQLKQHMRQLTQRCNLTHNRTECPGEALGKLLATINENNNVGKKTAIAQRTITCARPDYQRSVTDPRYILQIRRTDDATTLQTRITHMEITESIQDHEFQPCQHRAGNPVATTIATHPNNRFLQYDGGRPEDSYNWNRQILLMETTIIKN